VTPTPRGHKGWRGAPSGCAAPEPLALVEWSRWTVAGKPSQGVGAAQRRRPNLGLLALATSFGTRGGLTNGSASALGCWVYQGSGR